MKILMELSQKLRQLLMKKIYMMEHYNLDVVLSIVYRVKSKLETINIDELLQKYLT